MTSQNDAHTSIQPLKDFMNQIEELTAELHCGPHVYRHEENKPISMKALNEEHKILYVRRSYSMGNRSIYVCLSQLSHASGGAKKEFPLIVRFKYKICIYFHLGTGREVSDHHAIGTMKMSSLHSSKLKLQFHSIRQFPIHHFSDISYINHTLVRLSVISIKIVVSTSCHYCRYCKYIS